MYPRKRCSNKGPVASRETNVSLCFKRGKAVGYRAGLEKGAETAREVAAQRAAVNQQLMALHRPVSQANLGEPVRIGEMSLRALADLARQNGVRGYSRMRKDQAIAALLRLVRPGEPGQGQRLFVL